MFKKFLSAYLSHNKCKGWSKWHLILANALPSQAVLAKPAGMSYHDLLSKGHKVLNLDLIDFPKANLPAGGSIYKLKTDLSESGHAMNALTSLFNMGEYALPKHLGPPDAVIHFAACARNMLVPDKCSHANVMRPQAGREENHYRIL
jgi:hypothetical protein